jgi:dihydropteroate synthase
MLYFCLFCFYFPSMHWRTSRRTITLERALVMGVINITPDSFSDGGSFLSPDDALRQIEKLLDNGADIIDIGGESTRPGGEPVPAEIELERIAPVIGSVTRRFDVPISVDTTKSEVARHSIDAGAEIINDISGLRFDPGMANVAAETGCGLILMHSIGSFATLHTEPPVPDVFGAVSAAFRASIAAAAGAGVELDRMVLDVGIGFGKTLDQNLELVAKLDRMVKEFPNHPLLIGTSRKSFIGKITGAGSPADRLAGSLASAAIAVWNGASIVRVHDVRETRQALQVAEAMKAFI